MAHFKAQWLSLWIKLIVILLYTKSALATDLMDIYQDALSHDPIFKVAFSNYMSSAEAVPQARAALLPQLAISSYAGRSKANVVGGGFATDSTYNITEWQVNATQTVFNYHAWKMVSEAKASVKAAQARFNTAAQTLMLRVTNAYLDALLAQDTLNFQEAKRRANKRQYDQANARFKVGLEAITSVYEAKAAFFQSSADVIAAKNNLINRNEELRKFTNHVYEYLSPLRDGRIPLVSPEPQNIDEWVSVGLKQNYLLMAAKYAVDAARENVKLQSSDNWPVFTLKGNTQSTDYLGGPSSIFVPNHFDTTSITINVNFPVYQGGLLASKTRQAKYKFQSKTELLERVYRDVVVDSRISYNSIIDGISKVKADRQTVVSRINQVTSTSAQFEAGTRTMVDVTNAQQRLFESQVELAKDQYSLIKSQLKLKFLAGSLNANDLEEINAWLATTRINHFPHTY